MYYTVNDFIFKTLNIYNNKIFKIFNNYDEMQLLRQFIKHNISRLLFIFLKYLTFFYKIRNVFR
jgi:alpha-amylase/alpha-mannosidase (GH57 family)